MKNIIKFELWLLGIATVALTIMLAVNTINSNKLIDTYNTKIENYEKTIISCQKKIDSYEEELYILRSENREDKFVIDASLINTEMLNAKFE